MNVKELRIGNYVSTISEEPECLKIEGTKIYDDQSDEDCVRLQSFDHWTDVEDIEPIPLTEEWLLKFGFEYIEKKDSYRIEYTITQYAVAYGKRISIHVKKYENDEFFTITLYEIVAMDDITPTILQSVHQLQNLYFALTGEELKAND